MPLSVTSISQVDPALVLQRQAAFVELVAERYPELDLSTGLLSDLVALLHGTSAGVNQTEIDRILASRSLLAITEAPDLADDELVAAVLSNYLITRGTGTAASGTLAVIVTGGTTRALPAGFRFSANGVEFVTTRAYTAKLGAATNANDIPLTLQTDGTYRFQIDVVAVTTGTSGNLARLQRLTPVSGSLAGVVKIYADEAFSGGTDAEPLEDTLTRLPQGIASRAPGNRYNINALLRYHYPDIVSLSVIGHGAVEQLRSRHGVIPFAGGGRVDVYVRTAERPESIAIVKSATYQGRGDGGGLWQFTLGKEDAPGFYRVLQIYRDGDDPEAFSGYSVVRDTRGMDLVDSESFVPDIANADEAGYSRYQTAVIQFLDTEQETDTLTAFSSVADYVVVLEVLPDIAELQALVSSREMRNIGGDTLIKAPVPCWLSITCDIRRTPEAATPATDAIRQAIASYVNRVGFVGELTTAGIVNAVGGLLTTGQTFGDIVLQATLRKPNGASTTWRSRGVLTVPDDPEAMTTGRTVGFFTSQDSISITTTTVTGGAGL